MIPYPWCAVYGGRGGGGTNCGFSTWQQCMATVSGIGGLCEPNQFYNPRGGSEVPQETTALACIDWSARSCAIARPCSQGQFNIAQILQDALSLHQQGRLREAEKLYTRALKAAPDNFDALHLLGLINAQNGQMGEAYRLMSAALKINPNVPDVLINFANVLHGLKRDDEALASIDKALALRPGDPDALLHRGNALIALNRPNDALPCFDAVLARSRDTGMRFLIAASHAQLLVTTNRLSPTSMPILARTPTDTETLYNRGHGADRIGSLRRSSLRVR